MVETFRPKPDTRPVVQPEPSLILLFTRDFQPFTPPDTLNPLVVHMPACVDQQTGHHPLSVAPVLFSQLDDVIGQTLFIGTVLRHLPLRGPMLPERAAGPALGYAKFPPHMVDALATTRRAQKFPFAASVRMSLSKVRSDTALLSGWFSFSSSFRRASCDRCMPP